MTTFIKLGFVGTYKVDLLHYFSRILTALDKKVIVVDASNEQYLSLSLPESDCSDMITFQGIDFVMLQQNREELEKIDYSGYDIALVDYGFNDQVTYDYLSCPILFTVTDFQRHHVMKLKELIQGTFSEKINVVKLFRDVVACKIKRPYINRLLNIEEKSKVLAEYSFELNEEDYICRLFSQYDDVFKFTMLSKTYKVLFSDIIEEIYGLKINEISKAIKHAEGAKVCK